MLDTHNTGDVAQEAETAKHYENGNAVDAALQIKEHPQDRQRKTWLASVP